MAKSLRSKQKKANRIAKRQKNAKKELAKLEKVVELAKESTKSQESKKIYTVLGPASSAPDADVITASDKEETSMTVDGAEELTTTETALDTRDEDINEMPMNTAPKKANGSYPVWMNQRAIQRAKKAEKKKSKQKKKSMRSGGRPWRGR